MNRKAILLAIILIALLIASFIIAVNWFSEQTQPREFYLGVEYAYGSQPSELKSLVDEVKNYTNLFVIGSVQLTQNEAALTESCDYIANAGLKIIVLFTTAEKYNYSTFNWMTQAKQKYADQFLGVYRYDEPGGDQLGKVDERLVKNATNYTDAATQYVNGLKSIIDYYKNYAENIYTADYGLYWFDYQAGYTAIFAEFVGNQSRQLHIAQCRGAAQAHDKDWGTIITWKYDQPPYLENATELYIDLTIAYTAGAKYVIVFSYPKIQQYGTLTQDHLNAIEKFWNETYNNPQKFPLTKAEVAYVLPKDYGFGLRSPQDNIWGLFGPDQLSAKAWNDTNTLISQYDSRLDILYDDTGFNAVKDRYERVIFWNQTVT